jgi:predicted nucleic acid-binding protein
MVSVQVCALVRQAGPTGLSLARLLRRYQRHHADVLRAVDLLPVDTEPAAAAAAVVVPAGGSESDRLAAALARVAGIRLITAGQQSTPPTYATRS